MTAIWSIAIVGSDDVMPLHRVVRSTHEGLAKKFCDVGLGRAYAAVLVSIGPTDFAGYVARGLRLPFGIMRRVVGHWPSPSISAVSAQV